MKELVYILLPFMLLLGRITAMVAVLPMFSWRSLPMRVRAAIALVLTFFFASIMPAPDPAVRNVHWMTGAVLMGGEVLCGLALGLAIALIFSAVQQGGIIASRQMGFAMARVIDPVSGQEGQVIGTLFQICFWLLLLVTGGHHLMIRIMHVSFEAFPIGQLPDLAGLTTGLVKASSVMLMYALKIAGPLLASTMLISVVLGVMARIAPEMNILMLGFPLRVGMGLLMAAATIPYFETFTQELTEWITYFLIS